MMSHEVTKLPKSHTKSSRVNVILIRHSSRDSTEQTNPEKFNWHIMNFATQLAVKELLKSKCLVQFINTLCNI